MDIISTTFRSLFKDIAVKFVGHQSLYIFHQNKKNLSLGGVTGILDTHLSFSSICLRRARTWDLVSASRACIADTGLDPERGVLSFLGLVFEEDDISWQKRFISLSNSI